MRRSRGPDGLAYDVPQHVHVLEGKWRWIPPPRWRAIGAVAEKLTDAPAFTRRELDRANDLNQFWHEAQLESEGLAPSPRAPEGTVKWLIREFEQSVEYRLMSPRTREGVDWATRVIADAPIAKHAVADVRRHHCKQFYQACFDAFGHHQALRAITWLRKLLSFAMNDKGLIEINPAFNLELDHPPPRQVIWQWDEIKAVLRAAFKTGRWSVAIAVSIDYDSSQRLSDVLAVKWAQFDGEGIQWKQQKGGATGWTPLSQRTLRLLAAIRRRSAAAGLELGPYIVVNETTGQPYSGRGAWGRVFRKIRKAAGITRDLTFHDVRRTVGSEVLAGGGRAEPLTLHRPGSPVLKTYQVPSKEAARTAQARRQPVREALTPERSAGHDRSKRRELNSQR